jgi:hypothetical protein
MQSDIGSEHPLPELFTQRQWRRLARAIRLTPQQAELPRGSLVGREKED